MLREDNLFASVAQHWGRLLNTAARSIMDKANVIVCIIGFLALGIVFVEVSHGNLMIFFSGEGVLMVGFFVILLAMNMGPKGSGTTVGDQAADKADSAEMMDFIIGMREAFNNEVDVNSADPGDAPLIRWMLQRTSGETREEGRRVRATGSRLRGQAITTK